MPRYGKKTLYLDLDALDELQVALSRLPGRPSLSSYFNDQLPSMAKLMTYMVQSAEEGGLLGLSRVLSGSLNDQISSLAQVESEINELKKDKKNLDLTLVDIPPKKIKKSKSVSRK